MSVRTGFGMLLREFEKPDDFSKGGGRGVQIPLKGGFDKFWILSFLTPVYYLRVAVIIFTSCTRCLKSKILLKTPTFTTLKS